MPSPKYVLLQHKIGFKLVAYIIETEGNMLFRDPNALGCSILSAVRVLLRAWGSLNNVFPSIEVSN